MNQLAPVPERSRMDRAVEILEDLFPGRRDTYATFVPGEQYSGKREEAPLDEAVWRAHVSGQTPIGVYPLTKLGGEWVTQWACIDIDQDSKSGAALSMATVISEAAETKLCDIVPTYIEITKSKQAHLWLFFSEPTAAWKARAIARLVVEAAGFQVYKKGKGNEIVICPAHDSAPPKTAEGKGGLGMCIYLPWFGRNAREGRQVFMDPGTGQPFTDQVAAMSTVRRVAASTVDALVDGHDLRPSNVKPIAPKSEDDRAIPKAPAGTIPALTDAEFVNLCAKLKSLRSMRENPGGCTYQEWFSGIMHLVPFQDGRDRAHELSRLDSARYDANVTERQWNNAVAAYSRDDAQPEARVSQKIIEHLRAGGRPDINPIAPLWCIWKGGFARRKFEASGQEKDPTPITNFTASVICEEYVDNGMGERERCVRLRGSLMTGQVLPEITVPTKDWTGIKTWLHRGWGFRPVVYGDDRQVLQCISLCGQEAPERVQYTHTGWTTGADGKPMFLTPHGPRGYQISPGAFEEGARVATPAKLEGYKIPEACTDLEARQAYKWIERFLDCGKLEATAPLMSAMFLAPLASFLNLDFALFLTGHTGTHKSSLVAAAMSVWGSRWSKDTMPCSFNDTANALEGMAFHAKDLPLPIDNYVPNVRGGAQETLKRISHSFGDHSGRGRMNRNAELVAARPFRAFCILTGEDLPYGAGAGATNRYYIIQMQRETLKLMDLEMVQEAGWQGKMAPAMTHYLSYLGKKMEDPEWIARIVAFHYRMEKEARRRAAGKEHDRLTAQTAWMRTGLELIRQSNPNQKWEDASMDTRLATAFDSAIEQRRTLSKEASLPYRFLTAITYMVQSGKVHGVEVSKNVLGHLEQRPPVEKYANMLCGWMPSATAPYWNLSHHNSRLAMWVVGITADGDIGQADLCVRGEEMLTEIKQTLRTECPIAEGSRGVAQALVSDGIMRRGPCADRVGFKMIMGEGHPEITVWRLNLRKVFQILGWVDEDAAPPAIE